MEIYQTTDGGRWKYINGWDQVDLCYALGITCDWNGFVTEMYSTDSVLLSKKKKENGNGF